MATRHDKMRPLTDERPLLLRPHLAKQVGLVEAIVLERVWALLQAGGGRVRLHAGRPFVFYPPRAMLRDLSFLSRATLHRAVTNLKHAGLITQARLKDTGNDAGAWFTVELAAVAKVCSLFATAPADDFGGGGAGDDRDDDQGGGDPDAGPPGRPSQAETRRAQDETAGASKRDGHCFKMKQPTVSKRDDRLSQNEAPYKEQGPPLSAVEEDLAAAADAGWSAGPDGPPDPEAAAAAGLLSEEGYEADDAAEQVARFGARRVRVAVGNFRQVRKGGRTIYSPRGWIQSAIERGDAPLPGTPEFRQETRRRAAAARPSAAEVDHADAEHRRQEAILDGLTEQQWSAVLDRVRGRWGAQYPGRPFPAEPRRAPMVRAIARSFLFGPTTAAGVSR